nr:VOC family protein [Motilibacter deserti]
MHLELVAVLVYDYDEAIAFFVGVLGFELAEDSPATTNDGRPKRWVVVRPPGAATGILLARRTARPRPRGWASSSPGGAASSCASTTSTPPTTG